MGAVVGRDEIRNALQGVIDPELRRSIVELGMVRSIEVKDDGRVEIVVSLTTAGCPIRSHFEQAVAREAHRRGMDGVVCGHIHKAELRSIGELLYCNTGDWVESCTALAEHADGSLALLSFAGQERPARLEPRRDLAPSVS